MYMCTCVLSNATSNVSTRYPVRLSLSLSAALSVRLLRRVMVGFRCVPRHSGLAKVNCVPGTIWSRVTLVRVWVVIQTDPTHARTRVHTFISRSTSAGDRAPVSPSLLCTFFLNSSHTHMCAPTHTNTHRHTHMHSVCAVCWMRMPSACRVCGLTVTHNLSSKTHAGAASPAQYLAPSSRI